ncbi:MAG: hypothetical protein ACLFNS_02530 [Desulfobacterales bacterium]
MIEKALTEKLYRESPEFQAKFKGVAADISLRGLLGGCAQVDSFLLSIYILIRNSLVRFSLESAKRQCV